MKTQIVNSSSLVKSWHNVWEVERCQVDLENKRRWLRRALAMVKSAEAKLEQAEKNRRAKTWK